MPRIGVAGWGRRVSRTAWAVGTLLALFGMRESPTMASIETEIQI